MTDDYDEWEDEHFEDDDDPLKEWVMDCGNSKCCMNFAPHYRHECYEPEDYEAFVAEMESQSTSCEKP